MADFIKIVPERLKEEAGKIRGYKAEHEDIISRLNNLVFTLDESWEGEAQTAFVGKYQSMQREFQSFSTMLEMYAVEMEQIATKMQTADDTLLAKIGNLPYFN